MMDGSEAEFEVLVLLGDDGLFIGLFFFSFFIFFFFFFWALQNLRNIFLLHFQCKI
jgi:hypothetical protein